MKSNTRRDRKSNIRTQLLPESTPVPNFFWEIMAHKGIPKSYFPVLLVLWRQTVGWQKESDLISLTQIQRKARIGRRHAVEASRFWEQAGLFTREKNGYRGTIRFHVNLDFDPSQVLQKIAELVSKRNQFPGGTRTSVQKDTPLVPIGNTQKATIQKATKQKATAAASLECWKRIGCKPSGPKWFLDSWPEHYAAHAGNGRALVDVMEDFAQQCQAEDRKIPPPFFDSKRAMEKQIKEDNEPAMAML